MNKKEEKQFYEWFHDFNRRHRLTKTDGTREMAVSPSLEDAWNARACIDEEEKNELVKALQWIAFDSTGYSAGDMRQKAGRALAAMIEKERDNG